MAVPIGAQRLVAVTAHCLTSVTVLSNMEFPTIKISERTWWKVLEHARVVAAFEVFWLGEVKNK